MKTIEITQFHLPYGRRTEEYIDVNDESYEKYKEIRSLDMRITAEILRTGEASFCLEDPAWGDYDIFVCPNGSKVKENLEKMLLRFNKEKYLEWKKKFLNPFKK